MKNRRRLFSVLLLLLCSPVVCCSAAFAAEGVVENWYNTQQPYGESIYFYNDRSSNHYANYTENGVLFNNIALTGVTQMTFGFSDDNSTGGWEVSMVNAFDYYANVIVFGETNTVSDFSFYPTDFGVTYKAHDDTDITRILENVSISHYDTSHTLGYSACGRIPFDEYFGNPVKSFDCYHGSGSVPANIQCFLLIYQVPKSDEGVSADAAAIVQALQDQTAQLISKLDSQTSSITGAISNATDRLMDATGDLGSIAEPAENIWQQTFNDLDLTDKLNSKWQDSLTNEQYQVKFPAIQGPFLPNGEFVTILPEQVVDLSFMTNFSVITEALGFVVVIMCAWRTVEFLHRKLMLILGDPEADNI